jgi:hypothetical protein
MNDNSQYEKRCQSQLNGDLKNSYIYEYNLL